MKKRFLRLIVAVLCFPLVLVSGCLFYNENSTSTGIISIDGYKICYNNNEYELDNTYEIYATTILTELYACFGIPSDISHSSQIDTKPLINELSNYDRIRVQTNTDNSTVTTPWLWTFSTTTTTGVTSLEDSSTAVQYYGTSNIQTAYYNAFVGSYKVALEIACLQIVMGQTPTAFTIDINNTAGTTKVYYDTQKTKELTSETQTVLDDIKQEFSSKGKYIGMTSENIATLKTYILENVVGNNVINSVYNSVKISGGTATYLQLLNKILTVEVPLEKSIFQPYPANEIQDITNSLLYVKGSGTELMGHIPSYEYSSILIMPNSTCKITMLTLGFESEYDMEIVVNLNLYNYSTGQTQTSSSKNVSVKAGAWSANNAVFMTTSNAIPISAFSNADVMQATSAKTINNANENSKYYKLNENNTGVLNGSEVGQNYAEIVFEIQKTSNLNYYPFKVGLCSLMVV